MRERPWAREPGGGAPETRGSGEAGPQELAGATRWGEGLREDTAAEGKLAEVSWTGGGGRDSG